MACPSVHAQGELGWVSRIQRSLITSQRLFTGLNSRMSHNLRHFFRRWNADHVLIVGSGGSYSAAVTIAQLREHACHSATAAASPLECMAALSRVRSHVFLLSAEGRNKDILSAAECAASQDLSSGALTLTSNNPLIDFARQSGALRVFPLQMSWGKDGYLATNTLLAMVLVFFRVFFGDTAFRTLTPLLNQARLQRRREYLKSHRDAWKLRHGGLLVVYSMDAHSFAVDLESKLAEAAIDFVQIADLRQFAHGRHLQLSSTQAPMVVVASSKREQSLAQATSQFFPAHVNVVNMLIDGETPEQVAVAGILDAMFLTEAIAGARNYDPGQPAVPDFGRQVYGLDVRAFISGGIAAPDSIDVAVRRKMHLPAGALIDPAIRQSALTYYERLTSAKLKAVVCDYDGTLCRAENRYDTPSIEVVDEMSRLVRQGMVFAVATGRGDSLQKDLQAAIETSLHPFIWVGYYSGAYFVSLAESFARPDPNPEFQRLLDWLAQSAHGPVCNKPLDTVARGGQLSFRVPSARQSASLRAAIRAWLDAHGCRSWRVFSSGHSVDVLDEHTSKRNVVDTLSRRLNIDPLTQVLRLGDCGQEEGNDFELLSEGLSLSCHGASADLSACWNFGLSGCDQTETTLRYLRRLQPVNGGFQFDPQRSLFARTAA